jgi:radical SAM superfamily enzyme YgiQ (UPF0313 family)
VEGRQQLLEAETGDCATGQGALNVAFIFPNAYGVGMSSLGFQVARRAFRDAGDVRIERAFALNPDGTPFPPHQAIRTLETDRPLGRFDLLAFSISFELDCLHVLQALASAGLPLLASQRGAGWPLVVAGGILGHINPAPLYPFVDAFLLGRAEGMAHPWIEALESVPRYSSDPQGRARLLETLQALPFFQVTAGAWRAAALSPLRATAVPDSEPEKQLVEFLDDLDRALLKGRDETLRRLAGHEAWAEALLKPLREQGCVSSRTLCGVAPDGTVIPPAISDIATPHAQLGRRVLIEIARGCPHHCTFCWMGRNSPPFEPHSASLLLETIESACERMNCPDVGLIASAVGAHPEIETLCDALLTRGRRVSFSSLRAEETTPALFKALARSGQRSLTLAPETGDALLRRTLGKSLDDAGFLDVIENSQRAGLEDLKLYFMTGLPGETEEMADRMVAFTDQSRQLLLAFGRTRGRLGHLSVNLGIYVPKPQTPLARKERPSAGVIRNRVARLARALAALPNVRVAAPSVPLAAAQANWPRGDLRPPRFLSRLGGWAIGAMPPADCSTGNEPENRR